MYYSRSSMALLEGRSRTRCCCFCCVCLGQLISCFFFFLLDDGEGEEAVVALHLPNGSFQYCALKINLELSVFSPVVVGNLPTLHGSQYCLAHPMRFV